MIKIANCKQMPNDDSWDFLSPKRRKMLDNSWSGLFRKELLPELPVEALTPFFSNGIGRPTKELHTALGVLILQQMFDLIDEQTISELAFNIQWHYALNITEESDSAKYMSPRTLWNLRSIVIENDLVSRIFDSITAKLARVFEVNADSQRLDSVHIKSNMRRLGRTTILARTTHKFLVDLKRSQAERFETVRNEIVDKYFSEKSLQAFSVVESSQTRNTLDSAASDLFELVRQFEDCSDVTSMDSYKLLERVLNEQCRIAESQGGETVEIKKPKEIPSNSLQNPSDPDATYSGHKGQGFQAQIMETFSKEEDVEKKEKTLNLITHVHAEPSHESDANALIPAIESTRERNLGPREATVDALYGGDDNRRKAGELGVEIISPVMGSPRDKDVNLSDFEFSDDGVVISCPQGHAPETTKKKKCRHCAAFDIDHCADCPVNESCPAKRGKTHRRLHYTDKQARIAARRAYEKTDEFKNRYRWRAGVEATMSELDRRTGAKHLRVRGLGAVRFCIVLKAVAINIFRAAAVRKAKGLSEEIKSLLYAFILIVKERFLTILKELRRRFSFWNLFMKYCAQYHKKTIVRICSY